MQEWTFQGNITPKYTFMVGEIPVVDDFIIDGILTNGKTAYKSDDITINLVYAPLINEGVENLLEIDIYKKDDISIHARYSMHIKTVAFDNSINDNLNGIIKKTDKLFWKSADGFDTIYYDHDYDFTSMFKTPYGRIIEGYMQRMDTGTTLKIGYNTIKYKFIPITPSYNSEPIYGKYYVFYSNVNIYPKKNSISIGVNIKHYRVFLNGKELTKAYADNLKPNTKYKVVIKQRTTPKGKNVTVWSGTVTTKK